MIPFYPKPGMVLICDYQTGFIVPEMVKKRRVIVVSPYQQNKSGLCTVVPVSTQAPYPIEQYHYMLPTGKYRFFHSSKDCWVKCDMIARVGFGRLDRLRVSGKFMSPSIDANDLDNIRKGLRFALELH